MRKNVKKLLAMILACAMVITGNIATVIADEAGSEGTASSVQQEETVVGIIETEAVTEQEDDVIEQEDESVTINDSEDSTDDVSESVDDFEYDEETKTLIVHTKGRVETFPFIHSDDEMRNAEKIIFEEGATSIYKNAFNGWKNLKSVEFADSIEVIGEAAFSHSTITGEVKLPSNLKAIGVGAFYNCENITKIITHSKDVKVIMGMGEAVISPVAYPIFTDYVTNETITADNIVIEGPKNSWAEKLVTWYKENVTPVPKITFVANEESDDGKCEISVKSGSNAPKYYSIDGGESWIAYPMSGETPGSVRVESGTNVSFALRYSDGMPYTGMSIYDGKGALKKSISYPEDAIIQTIDGQECSTGWSCLVDDNISVLIGTTPSLKIKEIVNKNDDVLEYELSGVKKWNADKLYYANEAANPMVTLKVVSKDGSIPKVSLVGFESASDIPNPPEVLKTPSVTKSGDEYIYTYKFTLDSADCRYEWLTHSDSIDIAVDIPPVDYVLFLAAGADDAENGVLTKGGYSLINFESIASIDNVKNIPSKLDNGYIQEMKYYEKLVLAGDEYKRSGYTLTGWKNEKTGSIISNGTITNLTDETECITLTAQWKKDTYKITYNYNGGKLVSGYSAPVSFTVDNIPVVLPNEDKITRTGYKFAGWYDNKECKGEAISSLGVGTIELFAKWEPVEYTVKLDGNGKELGLDNTDIVLNYGDSYTIPIVSVPGYTFKSWNTNSDGSRGGNTLKAGATIKDLTAVDGSEIKYYAIWTANAYTIAYALNGGKHSKAPAKYATGDEVTLIEPAKTGYEFAGYTISMKDGSDIPGMSAGTKEADIAVDSMKIPSTIYGNVILTAKWNPISYTIRYYVGKDTVMKNESGLDSSSWTKDEELGWYYEKSYQYGEPIALNEEAKELEKEINDEESVSVSGFKAGKKTLAVSKSVTNLSNIKGDVVSLDTVWAEKTYHLTFNLAGGTLRTVPVSYKYNATKEIALPVPTKTGYIFDGWEEVGTSGNLTESGKAIKKGVKTDIILDAVWEPITYSVVINYNDDLMSKDTTSYTAVKYNSDTYPVSSSGYVKVGYTFAGFNTKANGSGIMLSKDADNNYSLAGISTKNKDTVQVYGIWSPNTYSVTYNMNDADNDIKAVNNVKNIDTFTTGKDMTLNAASREGYTFAGWLCDTEGAVVTTTNATASNPIVYIKSIKKNNAVNINLKAMWIENSYSVKFDPNSGVDRLGIIKKATLVASGKYTEKHNLIDLVKTDEGSKDRYYKAGYTLKGYYLDKSGKGEALDIENITRLVSKNKGTATIYAVWNKVEVSVPKIISITSNETGIMNVNYAYVNPVADYTSYEISYSKNYNFRNATIVNATSLTESGNDTKSINDLESGAIYYVRIREVKCDSNQKSYRSEWSKPVSIKVK